MVRLSLVNLYLHGFVEPHIAEYDTLTSEERWNKYADVILANPPFMSPKGGIRPHRRFSVQSKRSEVLFVDYIAEHLTPTGRAGIIVPEGIIFQSQTAHKQLRKMLVENYLVAVVSLPAGVFQPYSGVKMSILLLDKALAQKTDRVAFFKVENDGFDLGAQRREIAENDLPKVQEELGEYLGRLREGESVKSDGVAEPRVDYTATLGLIAEKEKIAEGGEYNLSGERYRETTNYASMKWPMVELGDVCDDILSGGTPSTKNEAYWNGDIPWITSADIVNVKTAKPRKYITEEAIRESATNLIKKGNVIVVTRVGLGKLFKNDFDVCISQDSQGLILKDAVNADYLVYVLKNRVENFKKVSQGSIIQGVTKRQLSEIQIPLPPLEVQQEIVAEIEGYKRVIDGAQAVIDNYRPQIVVDPEWPMVAIGEVCNLINGRAFKPQDWKPADSGGLPIVRIQNLNAPDSEFNYYTGEVKDRYIINQGQLLFSWSGSRGTSFGAHIWNGGKAILNQHIFKVEFDQIRATKMYLLYVLNRAVAEVEQNLHGGVGLVHITKGNLERIQIPIPPLATQQNIVVEIEAEQSLVAANRELVERMEGKIRAAIGRVWGS